MRLGLRAGAALASALLAALPAALLAALPAAGDPIPQEWLDQQYGSCVQSCIKGGTGADSCDQACSCAARELGDSMTRDQYAALANLLAAGKPLPPDVREALYTIKDRCQPD